MFFKFKKRSVLKDKNGQYAAFISFKDDVLEIKDADFDKEQDMPKPKIKIGYVHFNMLGKSNSTYYIEKNGIFSFKIEGKEKIINFVIALANQKQYLGFVKDLLDNVLPSGYMPSTFIANNQDHFIKDKKLKIFPLLFQCKINKHTGLSQKHLLSGTPPSVPTQIQALHIGSKGTCNNEVEKWIENASFQKFVAARFASENINFLLSLKNFQMNPHDKDVANNIVNIYIRHGSAQEINISAPIRRSLEEKLKNNSLTLASFSEAKSEIIGMLQFNFLHEFDDQRRSGPGNYQHRF